MHQRYEPHAVPITRSKKLHKENKTPHWGTPENPQHFALVKFSFSVYNSPQQGGSICTMSIIGTGNSNKIYYSTTETVAILACMNISTSRGGKAALPAALKPSMYTSGFRMAENKRHCKRSTLLCAKHYIHALLLRFPPADAAASILL